MKCLFAANWKMNKSCREASEYPRALETQLKDVPFQIGKDYDVLLAPMSLQLAELGKQIEGKGIGLAAQNSGPGKSGAYTGELSPASIKELGCRWVILGHSERRHVFKEDDLLVLKRAQAAMEEGLNVMLCVGELLQDRKTGSTNQVIEAQLKILTEKKLPPDFAQRLIIAYEPVWAIGTGENATPEQAQEVHAFIRQWFSDKISAQAASQLRILYGGSVKPENAGEIMAEPDVDGLLVGSASLDPSVFAGVIKNGLKSKTVGGK